MKRSTAFRFLLIMVLPFFVLGCNLAGLIGSGNEAEEPSQPAVIYVTATPQPATPQPSPTPTATPTPQAAGLTVLPCADYPEDCPSAVGSREFYEMTPSVYEYSFEMPSSTQLFLSSGWGAIDMATLLQNKPFVDFFLEIDGEDYFNDLYISVVEEPDLDDPSKMNGVVYMNVTVTGWLPHEPHTITIGYITTAALNDGWGDYDEGFEVRRVLHICPDGGCPGFEDSSSTSGADSLTFSPCLRAEDCPEATNIFQHIDFTDFEFGEEYAMLVPAGQPLLFQTGFYMDDPDYVEASLSSIDFFFEVDGVDRMQEEFVGPGTIENFMDPSVILSGYTLGVVVDGWVKNEPHRVRFGYITTADIFDGTETRPRGSTNEMLLSISPADLGEE